MMIGAKETKDGLTSNCAAIHWDRFIMTRHRSESGFFRCRVHGHCHLDGPRMKRAEYPEAVDVLTGYMGCGPRFR